MADRHVDHLLIGGGIAAATCARALRDGGASGSILVVSREPDPPYHRPPASKGLLQGREARDAVHVHPEGWYEAAGVELAIGVSVMGLDPVAKRVQLSTREEVGYDQALLATGAMVRRLRVEGAQLEGIHHLRTLRNAESLRADATRGLEVVCVGGSYIGCEVAAALASIGKRCTVLMLEDEPMQAGFGRRVGRYVRELLEAHGVEVVARAEVASFHGTDRVRSVRLVDGRVFPADVVVCGTGAVPDVTLARRAGLELGDTGGVRCDARLWTGVDGLYAAGDMCEFDSVVYGRRMRIEHEEVAAAQGEAAACNMLGAAEPYRAIPYFWTDLADWVTLEYYGSALAWDAEVVHGEPADGSFAVHYELGGRAVAVLSVNGAIDRAEALEAIGGEEPSHATS